MTDQTGAPQATVEDLAAIQARNVQLRAELIRQNAELEAALAASRSSMLSAAGFTDEDVRRLEHPEEFAHEAAAAQAQQITEQVKASLATRPDTAAQSGPFAPAPAAQVVDADAEKRAQDLSALEQAENAAKALRTKLFG